MRRRGHPRPLEHASAVPTDPRPPRLGERSTTRAQTRIRLPPAAPKVKSRAQSRIPVESHLRSSTEPLKNLPGSFSYLFDITAERYDADYVLIDLSPGLGSINQNLVATADYFMVPASPDVFSVMAVDSLSRVLPKWMTWAHNAAKLDALANADYPFPEPRLKFLGMIVQRYRLKSGGPTRAFRKYFEELDAAIDDTLIPAFRKAGLVFSQKQYDEAAVSRVR